jgi:DNA polymerase III subunit chi
MTRVNFYQVKGGIQAVMSLSCQLVEKAWQMNNDVLIYVPNDQISKEMSENLWSWSAASFLPHRTGQDGPESILIFSEENTSAYSNADLDRHHGLLINLAVDTPDWFSRFELLCEFVYGDEDLVADKRLRYKFYKDRGYPLNYHNMTDSF